MVVLIQDKHVLMEENQRLRMAIDRWVNGNQENSDNKDQ